MSEKLSIFIANTDPTFIATYVALLGHPLTLGSISWPGCPVHVVRMHDQIWAALDKVRPSALILDIGLPGGNSREFMQRIRNSEAHKHTVVIMTYPSVASHHDNTDMAIGIDVRLIEPIHPREMISFLHRILYLNRLPFPEHSLETLAEDILHMCKPWQETVKL